MKGPCSCEQKGGREGGSCLVGIVFAGQAVSWAVLLVWGMALARRPVLRPLGGGGGGWVGGYLS